MTSTQHSEDLTGQAGRLSERARRFCRVVTRRCSLPLLAAIAVAVAAIAAGCGSSDAADSRTPVGEQLAWVVSEVNDSATLTTTEAKTHLAKSFLTGFPAEDVVSV